MVGALYSINRPHTDNIKSRLKLWEIRKSKPSGDRKMSKKNKKSNKLGLFDRFNMI